MSSQCAVSASRPPHAPTNTGCMALTDCNGQSTMHFLAQNSNSNIQQLLEPAVCGLKSVKQGLSRGTPKYHHVNKRHAQPAAGTHVLRMEKKETKEASSTPALQTNCAPPPALRSRGCVCTSNAGLLPVTPHTHITTHIFDVCCIFWHDQALLLDQRTWLSPHAPTHGSAKGFWLPAQQTCACMCRRQPYA